MRTLRINLQVKLLGMAATAAVLPLVVGVPASRVPEFEVAA